MDILQFEQILSELAEELPEALFENLNGGVILSEACKEDPDSRDHDLFIMGEYHSGSALGRYIVIYYGSFLQVYEGCAEEEIKDSLRETLRHEFRHHLESQAGLWDLELEDAVYMEAYLSEERETPEEDDSFMDR